jgi:hypothetical protein
MWLRTEASSRLLWTRYWTFLSRKRRRVSRLAKRLLATQGLSSIVCKEEGRMSGKVRRILFKVDIILLLCSQSFSKIVLFLEIALLPHLRYQTSYYFESQLLWILGTKDAAWSLLIRVHGKRGYRIIVAWLPHTLIFKAVFTLFSPMTSNTKRNIKSVPLSNSWPCGEGAGDCLVFCQVCVYHVPKCQSSTVQERRWVLSGRSSSPSHSHDGKRLEMRGRLLKTVQ